MNTKRAEKILKAFANKRRLEIIILLHKHGERSVGEVANAIKLSFRATSQHLRLLESVDVVESRKEGIIVFYYIGNTHKKLLQHIINNL